LERASAAKGTVVELAESLDILAIARCISQASCSVGCFDGLLEKGCLRGRFDTYKHIQMEKNKKPCSSAVGGASAQQAPD